MSTGLVLAGFAIFAFGCEWVTRSAPEFTNDMEFTYVWTDHSQPNIIKDPYARSGHKLCRLDNQFPFSPTFNLQLKELDDSFDLTGVNLKVWLRADSINVNPVIVIEYRDEKMNTLFMESKSINMTNLNLGEWACYEHTFNVDPEFSKVKSNFIRVYCMNTANSAVYCDDLSLKLN